MSIPPITPAQAIALGVAAKAAGEVASSAFAKLLQSAADFAGQIAGTDNPTPTAKKTNATAGKDVGVLREQIGSLLQRFHAELKSLFGSRGLGFPASATLGQGSEGEITTDGAIPSGLVSGSPSLLQLFRSILARQRLLDSAEGREVGATQIRVTPSAAKIVSTP